MSPCGRIGSITAALALGAVLLSGGSLAAPTPSDPIDRAVPVDTGPAPIVIVLSWDGTRHDYLDRGELPAVQRVIADGVRAERLIPPFPSNTFPGHVTLATGTAPGVHGILDNQFHDRGRGDYSYSSDSDWLEVEPIWLAAERQGVLAATYFWVGSESTYRGRAHQYQITPFDGEIRSAAKVDQILAWLDLPEAVKPRLIMSWWHGADGTGHRKGPDHPDIATALAAEDQQLGRLLDGIAARGLWERTTLLLVSDHGMSSLAGLVDLRGHLDALGVEAHIAGGNSSVAHVFLDDPTLAPELLVSLRQQPNIEVYSGSALPRRWGLYHAQRTGDLVVVGKPGFVLSSASWWQQALYAVMGWWDDWVPGIHGLPPEHPDMGGIFLAVGRGVAAGTAVGPVSSLDVAPTIAHLLGIQPPPKASGRRVPALLPRVP